MADGGEGRGEDHAQRDADEDHPQCTAESLDPAAEHLVAASAPGLLEADRVADRAFADEQEEQRARCSPRQAGERAPADVAAHHRASSQ